MHANIPTNGDKDSSTLPHDDEGLLVEYDAVVCGTGLCQSIVASALARAGKTVLHVDAADYYGELDAVWTLPYVMETLLKKQNESSTNHSVTTIPSDNITQTQTTSIPLVPMNSSLRIHSLQSKTSPSDYADDLIVGAKVSSPYGVGTISEWNKNHFSFTLDDWKLAANSTSSVVVHVGLPLLLNIKLDILDYLATQNILLVSCRDAQFLLQQHSRGFALDLSPRQLFCAGPAVEALLTSKVSEYLEFKSLEGLLFGPHLVAVPCSKNDVFASSLLTPMDKRRLMKFLQLALDYATAATTTIPESTIGEETTTSTTNTTTSTTTSIHSLNERHLNQGRTLARPQNKSVATNEMDVLHASIAANMDFDAYLRVQQKLPPSLVQLVRFALALDTNDASSLKRGMDRLCLHLQSLGRFGTTAFLVPVYGSGELAQAFCRSAAVYGATYLLRRAPVAIVMNIDSRVESVELFNTETGETKRVKCAHAIVPKGSILQSTAAPNSVPSTRVLRRISVLRGKLISHDNSSLQQRHFVILPPKTVADHPHAIHGLVLDEAVNVVPHSKCGCTLVHLTTTIEMNDSTGQNVDTILEEALNVLIDSSKKKGLVEEIFHVAFSYALDKETDPSHIDPDGLHVIQGGPPDIAVDAIFKEAEFINQKICPEVPFLTIAEKVDSAIKERLGNANNDEDDEEQLVLESAMGMIRHETQDNAAMSDDLGI
jgi:RAB protein geranylgeranyltransferase component A